MQHMIRYVETDPRQVNLDSAGKSRTIRRWDIVCIAHDRPMYIGTVWHNTAILESEELEIIGEHMNEEHSLIIDRKEL